MTSPGGVEAAQTRAWQEAVDSLVKAMPEVVPARHVAEQFLKSVGEEFGLRLKLSEALAERDRARDTAALLESELAGAIRPQVLTEDTPEPARPWVIQPLHTIGTVWFSSFSIRWKDATGFRDIAGRPVYVIGGDRG